MLGVLNREKRKKGREDGELSAVLNDAEKSIKIRTEETITGSGKMKTCGELNKSSLSVVVAKNAGLKWIEGEKTK